MSAIIIGLGTTGLHIVEYVQRFHYQFTEKNKTDKIEYLFCETDVNVNSVGTPAGNDIKPVSLSLKKMDSMIPSLKSRNISNDWIPPVNEALATGDGAGGQSAYGRLALWMNWNSVRDAIHRAWVQVNGNNETNIYIVGSLTGGTCTGSFIDVAYLARNITESENIYGMFLIPGRNHVGIPGGDGVVQNYLMSMANLRELSHGKGQTVYDYTWPGGTHVQYQTAPFKFTYLLSVDYSNSDASMHSIKDLCRVVGMNLCMRVLDIVDVDGDAFQNFQHIGQASIVDAKTALPDMKFGTFGTTLIRYPKAVLSEWEGLMLGKSVLERWIDPEVYIDKNGIKQSVTGQRNRICNEFNHEFELAFEDALKSLDGIPTIGAPDMRTAIENDVEQLLHEPGKTILSLFVNNGGDNHYGFVANNIHLAEKKLVDSVYRLFDDYMDDYQNLFVLKEIYNNGGRQQTSLQGFVLRLLDFWKRQYGIDGDNFNDVLKKQVGIVNKGLGLAKTLLKRKEYLEEQLWNLYTLCKLHFSVPILGKILKNIEQESRTAMRGEDYVLPVKEDLDALIKKIGDVISLQGRSGLDIATRLNELREEMDGSKHFKVLFEGVERDHSGNRVVTDLKTIESKYNTFPIDKRFSGKNLVRGSVFSYLFSEKTSSETIYSDCVEKGMLYVQQNALIETPDINELLSKLYGRSNDFQLKDVREYLEGNQDDIWKVMPGLIGLRRMGTAVQFERHDRLRLIYATSNIVSFQNSLKNSPKTCYAANVSALDKNCVNVPALSNAVVVYQDYGFMVDGSVFDPVEHIDINSTIKPLVLKISPESRQARSPYISWDAMEKQLSAIQ